MPAYTNFYETLREAHMRLKGTVILYDKTPCHVMAITNNKDGIFRVYMNPIGSESPEYPVNYTEYAPDSPQLPTYLDQWMTDHPDAPLLRKQMNSPLFNKFRPFPLGMANCGTRTYYLERQPLRPKTEQGLTSGMITETHVTLGPTDTRASKYPSIGFTSDSMAACITGKHPSAKECLDNLLSGDFQNEAAAFHREFAFVKGPIDMLLLAYRTDIIGVLPKNNFDYLRLGAKFNHCREVVQALGLFNNIID